MTSTRNSSFWPQWCNEGEQGRAAAPGRRWRRGRKMRLPVDILGGQMVHKRGAKLSFSVIL